MTRFRYEDILAINQRICELSGEKSLVINADNIRSALSVQHSYYQTEEEIRAALFHHLIVAHGFQDANKRTAVVVLLYDGGINISQSELEKITLEVASERGSSIEIEELAARIFSK